MAQGSMSASAPAGQPVLQIDQWGETSMANMVTTHAVGDMNVWLSKGAEREALFASFCSSYRIYRHRDSNRVSIVSENVDLEKVDTALSSPEMAAAMEAHTVLPPVDFYVEIPGAK
jgi:hypothetical protein